MPLENDEQTISVTIAERNEKKLTIFDKAIIDETEYQFEKREFYPGFSMVLPESFEELPPEYIRVKYPREDRPDIILSNTDTTVNFAFANAAPSPDDLNKRLVQHKAILKRLLPGYVSLTDMVIDLENGMKVACYDYRINAADADVYCLNFFTDLPEEQLFCWFTCPLESQDQWAPLVREMIKTIELWTQDEENEQEKGTKLAF